MDREMNRIRVLPEHIANKIAAGEVVERPASAVKELVENSIDAGARLVIVQLTAGGKRSVSVTDDGCGMARDDAILAFERHATSKVVREDDLDHIVTLGFRGEALPSIAAVSKLTLVTRTPEALAGTRVILAGGVVKNVTEVGAPAGTRVTVNSLYFNTPARAKFLKSTSTELSHSVDIVQRHALALPRISFRLIHNGKELFNLPPVHSLADRAALLWGPKVARDLVAVDAERNRIRTMGLVGMPTLYRAQKNMQLFFLNGRPIVNRTLTRATADAYRGLLPTGKFPVAILFVNIDPAAADVNVHPTKREVKFRHEREVHDAVVFAVRSALEAETVKPVTTPLRRQPPAPAPTPTPRKEHLEKTARLKRVPDDMQSLEREESGLKDKAEVSASEPEEAGALTQSEEQSTTEAPAADSPLDLPPLFSSGRAPIEAPFQVFGTYLVAPQENRLLIIDQHALHERITYERLKRELGRTRHSLQRLLVPINMEFSPAEAKLIEEYLPLLDSIGLHIEPFGGTTYIVTAICSLFSESKVEELVRYIVAELEQGELLESEESLRERLLVLSVSACRSSIKANEPLSAEERAGLLAGLRDLSPPYTCPHGRPIMTELTLEQLERSFRRR
jgi:DNA mismatch repair protein MutL